MEYLITVFCTDIDEFLNLDKAKQPFLLEPSESIFDSSG